MIKIGDKINGKKVVDVDYLEEMMTLDDGSIEPMWAFDAYYGVYDKEKTNDRTDH